MHHASISSSRSSSTSSTGKAARTHWYRSSLGSGIMNLPGSLATSAARSSLPKPNPIRSSSAETDAYTILPTRNFVWSLMRCSDVRGSAIAIRRTSSRVATAGQPARLTAPARSADSAAASAMKPIEA
jgi:hypothetical protein